MAAKLMQRCMQSHLRVSVQSSTRKVLPSLSIAKKEFSTSNISLGTMYYSKDHEYLNVTDNIAKVGITDHAQKELGDVVFVDLPDNIGEAMEQHGVACSVESVKAVADVYLPISGKLLSVNTKLEDTPELVNSSPEENGWLVEVEILEPEQLKKLLNGEDYNKYLEATD